MPSLFRYTQFQVLCASVAPLFSFCSVGEKVSYVKSYIPSQHLCIEIKLDILAPGFSYVASIINYIFYLYLGGGTGGGGIVAALKTLFKRKTSWPQCRHTHTPPRASLYKRLHILSNLIHAYAEIIHYSTVATRCLVSGTSSARQRQPLRAVTLSRLNFFRSPNGLRSSRMCSSFRVSGRFITISTPLSSFLGGGGSTA